MYVIYIYIHNYDYILYIHIIGYHRYLKATIYGIYGLRRVFDTSNDSRIFSDGGWSSMIATGPADEADQKAVAFGCEAHFFRG